MTKTVLVLGFVRKNPHMGLAALLFMGFMGGIVFLSTNVPTIARALFGAGASLLGAWVTEVARQN